MHTAAALVLACSISTAVAGSVFARAELAHQDTSAYLGGQSITAVGATAKMVPCGESFLSRLHDSSHCVFFIIPQGSAHPENNQHFHNCCFGKWRSYNAKIKKQREKEEKEANEDDRIKQLGGGAAPVGESEGDSGAGGEGGGAAPVGESEGDSGAGGEGGGEEE